MKHMFAKSMATMSRSAKKQSGRAKKNGSQSCIDKSASKTATTWKQMEHFALTKRHSTRFRFFPLSGPHRDRRKPVATDQVWLSSLTPGPTRTTTRRVAVGETENPFLYLVTPGITPFADMWDAITFPGNRAPLGSERAAALRRERQSVGAQSCQPAGPKATPLLPVDRYGHASPDFPPSFPSRP